MKRLLVVGLIVVFLGSGAGQAYADTNAEMMSALESMKQQIAKMQETIDRQNARIEQLESSKTTGSSKSAPSVSTEGAQAPLSQADWQKGIKDNLGEAIPWLKGTKFSGDLRLRYEALDYFDKNNDAGSTGGANDRTRNRFRVRLRWGMEKDFGDDWKVGFRLATGNTTDPNSTNQTLGNSGDFNFKTINIDRAYALYEPSVLKNKGVIKGVRVGAGKFENPFLRYSTGIVWDPDVTPEGAYEQADWNLVSQGDDRLSFQSTTGQFIVNENAGVDTDANIFGYQAVGTWSTYRFSQDQPVDLAGAVSYYDHTNWYGTVKNNTAGTSYLRTNSIVADRFRVLDVYPELQFSVNKTPVTLWYDYAKNLANVGTEDLAQSGGNDIHDADEAWGLGAKLGKTKKKGSWELYYGYYEIGANSVVAAFNDGDFGGPGTVGYTNRKGHKFGFGYQLTDNLVISWSGLIVRPLNPYNGNATLGLQNSSNESVFRSQVDAVYKF